MERHRSRGILFVLALVAASVPRGEGQTPSDYPHETLFYTAGGLRLEAYLYMPPGSGPFPLVVYNHGSRAGAERAERPFAFIGQLLTPAGYAVLVPERRGYGKSEGPTFSDEIGSDRGSRFIARLRGETDDLLAAAEHVLADRARPIDPRRVAMIGWSFGGIVTTFAVSQSDRYRAAVIQAPGALNWPNVAVLRDAMTSAAKKITIPLQCLVAANDLTTDSARVMCETAKKAGATTELKIYPPFTPSQPAQNPNAAGHAIFGAEGVQIWRDDVLRFLAAHVRGAGL